jgi:aspartyl-tRNA(Asn)/glutamyl-tRNA(Gln) amidotransferase subunit A
MAVVMPEAVSVHERWLKDHRDEYSAEVLGRLEAAQTMSAVEYIRAQRARRWFNEQMASAMADVDVLITPTIAVQTPTIEDCASPPGANEAKTGGAFANFTGVFNTTGMPSLSVTCGFKKARMPVGMMISGKPFEDPLVLGVGHAYERLAGHWRRHPPL